MKRLFRLYSFNFEMETNDETVAQIRAITKNDILEVLPKLLNLEEKALVFYGPKINKSIKQEIENQRIEESLRAMQQNSDEIKVIKEKALLIQQLLNERQQGE